MVEQILYHVSHHAYEVVQIILIVNGQLTAVLHVKHAGVLLPDFEILLVELEIQMQFELEVLVKVLQFGDQVRQVIVNRLYLINIS